MENKKKKSVTQAVIMMVHWMQNYYEEKNNFRVICEFSLYMNGASYVLLINNI